MVVLRVPACAAVMCAMQLWLSAGLASGALGRTPAAAVFLPVLFWLVAGLVAFVAMIWRKRREHRVAFAICAVGAYSAWNALVGFLAVA